MTHKGKALQTSSIKFQMLSKRMGQVVYIACVQVVGPIINHIAEHASLCLVWLFVFT